MTCVTKLISGPILRPGIGFSLWTETGSLVVQLLKNKSESLSSLKEKLDSDMILAIEQKVSHQAKSIFDTANKNSRNLQEIEQNCYQGFYAEIFIVLNLQQSMLMTYEAWKTPRSKYDIEVNLKDTQANNIKIEVKSFPELSANSYLKFKTKHTFKNVSQVWPYFDILVTVLHRKQKDDIIFSTWQAIDSSVFWSQSKMFSETLILDENRAINNQSLINLRHN